MEGRRSSVNELLFRAWLACVIDRSHETRGLEWELSDQTFARPDYFPFGNVQILPTEQGRKKIVFEEDDIFSELGDQLSLVHHLLSEDIERSNYVVADFSLDNAGVENWDKFMHYLRAELQILYPHGKFYVVLHKMKGLGQLHVWYTLNNAEGTEAVYQKQLASKMVDLLNGEDNSFKFEIKMETFLPFFPDDLTPFGPLQLVDKQNFVSLRYGQLQLTSTFTFRRDWNAILRDEFHALLESEIARWQGCCLSNFFQLLLWGEEPSLLLDIPNPGQSSSASYGMIWIALTQQFFASLENHFDWLIRGQELQFWAPVEIDPDVWSVEALTALDDWLITQLAHHLYRGFLDTQAVQIDTDLKLDNPFARRLVDAFETNLKHVTELLRTGGLRDYLITLKYDSEQANLKIERVETNNRRCICVFLSGSD